MRRGKSTGRGENGFQADGTAYVSRTERGRDCQKPSGGTPQSPTQGGISEHDVMGSGAPEARGRTKLPSRHWSFYLGTVQSCGPRLRAAS